MRATLSMGVAATTVAAMPTLLVGALAVLIQRDLRFGEAELGTAIALSFATAAVIAAPAGRLSERLGPRRTTWLGLAFAMLALLGIGLLARSWVALALFLAVAGAGITSVQLGVNVLLARAVPAGRQGIAFGAKQAAVPLASLLAGLAVPTIGLTVGWPAAFILGAAFVPVAAWRMPDAPPRRRTEAAAGGEPPLGTLTVLAIGVALASAGGNSVPAFIVPSAVDRGFDAGHAGLVLAGGSLVGIGVRVTGGWLGDRLGRGSLLLVVGLVGIGAAGFIGLSLADHPVLILAFTALAFGGGWGWGGLLLLAISRSSPTAPGRAMGIVQVGPMSGAVLGPLLFGILAEHVGFPAAWTAMALLAIAGAATILASRQRLVRGRGPSPTVTSERGG